MWKSRKEVIPLTETNPFAPTMSLIVTSLVGKGVTHLIDANVTRPSSVIVDIELLSQIK